MVYFNNGEEEEEVAIGKESVEGGDKVSRVALVKGGGRGRI